MGAQIVRCFAKFCGIAVQLWFFLMKKGFFLFYQCRILYCVIARLATSNNFVNVCVYIQDVTIFVDFGAKIGIIR